MKDSTRFILMWNNAPKWLVPFILIRFYHMYAIEKIKETKEKLYLNLTVKKVDYYDIMTNIDKPKKWYKFK